MIRKRILTLGTRGTDVALSALDLGGRSFSLDDIYERYGRLNRERGTVLADHFQSSVRNELQRLSSDCLVFEKENRKLDLFAQIRPGLWAIRDEARPHLITAANNHADDLLKFQHTLLVPVDDDGSDDDDDEPNKYTYTNEIGAWAQKKIMGAMRLAGGEIIGDTSTRRAYDFQFYERPRDRTHVPQIMESKGTRRSRGDFKFKLSANELIVWGQNRGNYWLGVVYNIEIVNGQACGGSAPFITPPPIDREWCLGKGYLWTPVVVEVGLFGAMT